MNTKTILATWLGLMLIAVSASAYTIDGDLSDWGVTPFVDWVPDSATAEWVEENYDGTNPEPGPVPVGYPYGGETFDIEWFAVDDGPGVAYFAAVVSMPEGGYPYDGDMILMGDIALDVDNNKSTGDRGFEYGVVTRGADKGKVCEDPVWTLPHCRPAWGWCNVPNAFSHLECPGGFSRGGGTCVYADAGVLDNGRPNYIIECSVPKVLIGEPEQGEISSLHSAMSCANDLVELNDFTWDFPAPEFISALIPLLILLTVPTSAYILVRKRK